MCCTKVLSGLFGEWTSNPIIAWEEMLFPDRLSPQSQAWQKKAQTRVVRYHAGGARSSLQTKHWTHPVPNGRKRTGRRQRMGKRVRSKIDREGGGKGKGEEERVGRWETLCHQWWAIFPRSLGSQLLLLISHYVAEGTGKIRVMW